MGELWVRMMERLSGRGLVGHGGIVGGVAWVWEKIIIWEHGISRIGKTLGFLIGGNIMWRGGSWDLICAIMVLKYVGFGV